MILNFDFKSFYAIIITFESIIVLNGEIKGHKITNNNFIQLLFQPELGLYPLKPGNNFSHYIVKENYLLKNISIQRI